VARTPEHRRLLAVLVGDIVGYSRLMARKEADTYYRVKHLQASLIVPVMKRNRGRVVKWTGDGFISTFASAVDAVRTAVEIQSGTTALGVNAPEDLRICFRMGVNVGDVIVAPDDVYGDAVNIAVRLQTAAPPEGICVSRGVRDAVSGKVGIEFENRGELAVKNIPEPVGAYAVLFDPVAWTIETNRPAASRVARRLAVGSAVAIVCALILGSAWLLPGLNTTTTGLSPQQALRQRLRELVPGVTSQTVDGVARGYEQGLKHKALAASAAPSGYWYTSSRANEDAASEAALESCQVAYGSPCRLVLVNDEFQPPSSPVRDMPRARYSGPFAPDMIPAASPASRSTRNVLRYPTVSGPKAIAWTPSGGRVFVNFEGDDQRAAEERALTTCYIDPTRASFNAPCFLYAVGDQVVLPLRRQEPFTRATP
jgi:class 3 adenylate cyclase